MRIGIDAHILGKQKGGVETCVEQLIYELARLDRVNEYFIYVSRRHPFIEHPLPPNFCLCPLPWESPWIQRSVLVPYLYRRDRLDVIHLQRAMPFFGCERTLLHVHDVIYKTHPHLFPRWKRAVLNPIFQLSCRRAQHVVTTTSSSKSDIVRFYHVEPDKIHIVPDGVNTESFYPVRDEKELSKAKQAFGLSSPYVMYLGALERNKNVHILVEAFGEFIRGFPDYKLALVGKYRSETRGGYVDELKNTAERLKLTQNLVFTGYVSEKDRRLLLNGAKMVAFPSECEGFGLPPLEAMACGIPAIASGIPVISEVYGDSVLTCRPGDPQDLARAMQMIASDPNVVAGLVQRGTERVASLRWESHAREMLKLYQLFLRSSPW